MTPLRAAAAAVAIVLVVAPVMAQGARPRATVTAIAPSTPAKAGETVRLSLGVSLPEDVHVQANKPRDPLLVPTVLTVEAPPGTTVEAVSYPAPTELAQTGRTEPLAVLGPDFVIDVRLSIASTAAGAIVVPAVLRYQACNDALCFPPARVASEWTLLVEPPG